MIWARWAVERIGYWVRPYDMLADRRRRRWQPREQCQWSQTELDAARQRARVRAAEFQQWRD